MITLVLNLHILQGGVGLHDLGWFSMDASNDYRDLNSALYEDTSLLPCTGTGPDVYSVDSGAESLQEMLNSMQESTGNMNGFSNAGGSEDTGITGINIRSRQTRQTAPNNLPAQQGLAKRRIILQYSVEDGKRLDFEDGKATVGMGKSLLRIKKS